MTLRIYSDHFCAGVVLEDGKVTRAAPILAYMKGWNLARVTGYCDRKNWRWQNVSTARSEAT